MPQDFSQFSRLSVWVRSQGGAPSRIKLELVDNTGVHVAYIPDYSTTSTTPISTTWQNYILNFSTFSTAVNAQAIQQFNIVYENTQAGQNAQGVLYYDELEFVP